MNDHLVTVFRCPKVFGWNGKVVDGKPVREDAVLETPQLPVRDALEEVYDCDAHFSPYFLANSDGSAVPDGMRVNKGRHINEETGHIGALGSQVLFSTLVVDVDSPGHVAADPAWVESQVAIVDALPDLREGFGWYATRGGYRLLWLLPSPVPPARYTRILSALVDRLAKVGIVADKLTDWNRLYRLPHVLRDGTMQELPADWGWLAPLPDAVVAELEANYKSPFAGIGSVRAPLQLGEAIPAGQRNKTMIRLAGQFRRAGMQESEILEMLRVLNVSRCPDPLPDSELADIARKVCRYDPSPEAALLPVSRPEPATALPLAERGGGSKPVESADSVGTDAPPDGDDFPFGDPEDTLSTTAGSVDAPASGSGSLAQSTPKSSPDAPRFFLGSEVEIADAVAQELEGEGERMVFDRGHVWHYQPPAGVWEDVPETRIYGATADLDGEWIVTGVDKNGNPKAQPLKVSGRLCREVRFLVQARRSRPGFFDAPADGICFANGFARVQPGEVELLPFSSEHRQYTRLPFGNRSV